MADYVVQFGGERIDVIAAKLLETERDGATEALLDTNPGLALKSPFGFAPAGTRIRIPESFSRKAKAKFILAWE